MAELTLGSAEKARAFYFLPIIPSAAVITSRPARDLAL